MFNRSELIFIAYPYTMYTPTTIQLYYRQSKVYTHWNVSRLFVNFSWSIESVVNLFSTLHTRTAHIKNYCIGRLIRMELYDEGSIWKTLYHGRVRRSFLPWKFLFRTHHMFNIMRGEKQFAFRDSFKALTLYWFLLILLFLDSLIITESWIVGWKNRDNRFNRKKKLLKLFGRGKANLKL